MLQQMAADITRGVDEGAAAGGALDAGWVPPGRSSRDEGGLAQCGCSREPLARVGRRLPDKITSPNEPAIRPAARWQPLVL